MDLSDELLEQIGAYLAGQLSATEKSQFDARLQHDPALQQEVALQRELKQGLSFLAQKDRFKQLHADLDKRGLLTEVDKQAEQPTSTEPPLTEPKVIPFPDKRSVVRYGWASWAMAASLVLLLGIGWVLYRNQLAKRETLAQNERVFDNFFSTDLKSAPALLPDPDRVAASPHNDRSGPDSIRLYAAVEDMQRVELQPVISELSAISTGQPGHWAASAQWYLALAYLKNNQRAEAQLLLQKIARLSGHPYQQEARQLLSQLALPVASDRP